ncbi:BtpA/SgcQ family protein [Sinorhizobium meliloti]|uniref:BtpA/SgcQ family protein n=1 Tax=Rhizobium meliloti TaxID=382 RepID=UPI002357AD19|nr:BtpA/SgcQ family protein [Sinorhizobium meliloti]
MSNGSFLSDGAVVGSTFKIDGVFENAVDPARVKSFMDKVKLIRSAATKAA